MSNWIPIEDRPPENEEQEYAVTDGESNYIAYYGFNYRTKKTEFSSTSYDFNSLHGCKEITHFMPLPELPKNT